MTSPTPSIYRFSHDAMASTFQISLVCDDQDYAAQASRAAFDLLDEIEKEISRYILYSDIAQVNALPAGQGIRVGAATIDCITLSFQYYEETSGLFDITMGPLIDFWKKHSPDSYTKEEFQLTVARCGLKNLLFIPQEYALGPAIDGVGIDLGGIGKGYALDQMASLIREDWEIDSIMLQGGESSVIAFGTPIKGEPGWPITLDLHEFVKDQSIKLHLKNRAMSGSSLRQQPQHIINPKTGFPEDTKRRAWSTCPTAAQADAFSTAFLLMSLDHLSKLCAHTPSLEAYIYDPAFITEPLLRKFESVK